MYPRTFVERVKVALLHQPLMLYQFGWLHRCTRGLKLKHVKCGSDATQLHVIIVCMRLWHRKQTDLTLTIRFSDMASSSYMHSLCVSGTTLSTRVYSNASSITLG
jgi:hypothetical protein